jgi:hypothetical protein
VCNRRPTISVFWSSQGGDRARRDLVDTVKGSRRRSQSCARKSGIRWPVNHTSSTFKLELRRHCRPSCSEGMGAYSMDEERAAPSVDRACDCGNIPELPSGRSAPTKTGHYEVEPVTADRCERFPIPTDGKLAALGHHDVVFVFIGRVSHGRNVPQSRRVPRPRHCPRDGSGKVEIAGAPVATSGSGGVLSLAAWMMTVAGGR